MKRKRQVIILYIPGLVDIWDPLRRLALRLWRLQGAKVEFVPMNWQSDETIEEKLSRVRSRIAAWRQRKYTIVLVGESAGGCVALNALLEQPDSVHKVVTVCGLNNPYARIGPPTQLTNPAIQPALDLLAENMKRLRPEVATRIISIHPEYDPTVAIADTKVPGGTELGVAGKGHMSVITRYLTIRSRFIIRLIKKSV